MRQRLPAILLITGGLLLAHGLTAATAGMHTEEIRLQRLEAKGALTVLRSIADAKQLEVVDAKTLRIQDSAARILLARQVLELVERADDPANRVASFDAGDGTTVARVVLRHADSGDVLTAVRNQGVDRIAVLDGLATVVLRDNAEKVKAALERVRMLDGEVPK